MKPTSGYTALESSPPLLGLITALPPNKLQPNYTPNCLNAVFRDGAVRSRGGTRRIGQRLLGSVKLIAEFGPIDSDPGMVVITTKRAYFYDEVQAKFIDITPGRTNQPITAVDQTLKTFTISGDHTAYFSAGREFPVFGGPNEGIYTTVSSTFSSGSTVISVSESIPSPTVSGNIITATDFTATLDDEVFHAILTDTNGHRILVTNGVDPPVVWDGNHANPMTLWSPNFPDFITCKCLAVFAGHLLIANIRTTTNVEPFTVAWSDAGDFDEFVAGTAGVQILHQVFTDITAMRVLGDRLAVYSRDSITTAIFAGLPAVFVFETIIPAGIRLVSGSSIASIDIGHIYVSEENFYLFDGTRGLRVLGEKIHNDYKANKDHASIRQICSLNDTSRKTLYFAIPSPDANTTIYTAMYEPGVVGELIWSRERYHKRITAFGFYRNRMTAQELTWEDAPWEPVDSPWSSEEGSWVEETSEVGFPIRAYGTSDGYVLLCVESPTDDGEPITFVYETKSFELPDVSLSLPGRWIEIEFDASGGDVTVSYATLSGTTVVGTVEAGQGLVTRRLPIDVVAPTISVQLSSTNPLEVRWIRVWGKSGGSTR